MFGLFQQSMLPFNLLYVNGVRMFVCERRQSGQSGAVKSYKRKLGFHLKEQHL